MVMGVKVVVMIMIMTIMLGRRKDVFVDIKITSLFGWYDINKKWLVVPQCLVYTDNMKTCT